MSEFTDYVTDILAPLGEVRIRRMFGGYGVYYKELMFGLIADDMLYLKVDAQSAGDFQDRDLSQFTYLKRGNAMKLGYYMAPEEIYEDPSEARLWATKAYDAALRKRQRPAPPKKRRARKASAVKSQTKA